MISARFIGTYVVRRPSNPSDQAVAIGLDFVHLCWAEPDR